MAGGTHYTRTSRGAATVLSGRTLVEWIRQTSRCQAFILLSCGVILVESFICDPRVAVSRHFLKFHRGEELTGADLSWNSTATAMNAACCWSSHPMMERTTESLEREKLVDRAPPGFEFTVSHETIDYWFHVLGGMEEEDVVD